MVAAECVIVEEEQVATRMVMANCHRPCWPPSELTGIAHAHVALLQDRTRPHMHVYVPGAQRKATSRTPAFIRAALSFYPAVSRHLNPSAPRAVGRSHLLRTHDEKARRIFTLLAPRSADASASTVVSRGTLFSQRCAPRRPRSRLAVYPQIRRVSLALAAARQITLGVILAARHRRRAASGKRPPMWTRCRHARRCPHVVLGRRAAPQWLGWSRALDIPRPLRLCGHFGAASGSAA